MKNGAFAEAKDFACKLSQSVKSLWQHRSNCFVLPVLPAFCVLLFINNYYHSLYAIVLLLFISAVIFYELFIILQAMLIEQNYQVDLGS